MIKSLKGMPFDQRGDLGDHLGRDHRDFSVPVNDEHDGDPRQPRQFEEVQHGVLIVRLILLDHVPAVLFKFIEYLLFYLFAVDLCEFLQHVDRLVDLADHDVPPKVAEVAKYFYL